MQQRYSLKEIANRPEQIIQSAFHLYRSKKMYTFIVEGKSDERFLKKWLTNENSIRFDGLDGKELVKKIYRISTQGHYKDKHFLCFFADIDYDLLCGSEIISNKYFIYFAYSENDESKYYNDLESFLINSSAYDEILKKLGISSEQSKVIKNKLEACSRQIGKYRFADIEFSKKKYLENSTLNRIEIEDYVDPEEMIFKNNEFILTHVRWANNKHLLQEYYDYSENLKNDTSQLWSLSRGHDITKILFLYLIKKKLVEQNIKIEEMLQDHCAYSEFLESPMGKKLKLLNEIFLYFKTE
ncbi:hypothetical protein [Leptospira kirschneri]|uniref:hypothetical protein n=1 Tax=Leptospira kirschneri TaxID=29507 RepID=UPI0002BF2D2B|nr:hypothetical protein [Leptospira kirschneri]EMO80437.1 hypothetical protein LEP1GSC126_2946 [Leptospira kirschneri str. 200801774]KON79282.1 Uncharacterized protein NV38_0000100 [Leptospira kirschneri serovar Mozdok]KPZ77111.1 hypothetical protein APS47_12750 [Leptospira kirschneri serovar Mozdok]